MKKPAHRKSKLINWTEVDKTTDEDLKKIIKSNKEIIPDLQTLLKLEDDFEEYGVECKKFMSATRSLETATIKVVDVLKAELLFRRQSRQGKSKM